MCWSSESGFSHRALYQIVGFIIAQLKKFFVIAGIVFFITLLLLAFLSGFRFSVISIHAGNLILKTDIFSAFIFIFCWLYQVALMLRNRVTDFADKTGLSVNFWWTFITLVITSFFSLKMYVLSALGGIFDRSAALFKEIPDDAPESTYVITAKLAFYMGIFAFFLLLLTAGFLFRKIRNISTPED